MVLEVFRIIGNAFTKMRTTVDLYAGVISMAFSIIRTSRHINLNVHFFTKIMLRFCQRALYAHSFESEIVYSV